MLKDRMITEEEVTQNEFDMIKSIRNSMGYPMKDDELIKFYVEWNNICYTLKHTPNKKRR